jgi:hypothetical protein
VWLISWAARYVSGKGRLVRLRCFDAALQIGLEGRKLADDWLTGLTLRRTRFQILPDCVDCHAGLDRDVPEAVYLATQNLDFHVLLVADHGPPKRSNPTTRCINS